MLDTEAAWDRLQQAEVVREAVAALPLRLQRVVILREFEGLPYRTMAEILGVPIGRGRGLGGLRVRGCRAQ
ncbi:MAG TPA: sigma factor-like helix-turn-helix DNA-binding protein [Candidatus Dormibacteraeota bacterium]|nr:sigma factor-like helix-turn-helix DNA-binding protein [Candidatus Dormibacteraeota bacterium]